MRRIFHLKTIKQVEILKFLTKPIKLLSLRTGAGIRIEQVQPQTHKAFDTYLLNTLRVYVEINKVKNQINPTNGYRSKLIMDKGGHIFGVSTKSIDFSRISASHSQYSPISPKLTIATRIFGGVYTKNSTKKVFETEKFSLGGSNSLRGYPELALYGRYRLSLNLESRYQFNNAFIGVIFIDGGYISNSINTPFNTATHMGYGIGGRFLKTFIPIRLDVGIGRELMVHVNVAQMF